MHGGEEKGHESFLSLHWVTSALASQHFSEVFLLEDLSYSAIHDFGRGHTGSISQTVSSFLSSGFE